MDSRSSDLKRKVDLTTVVAHKRSKYSSIIDVIANLECNSNSKIVLQTLIDSGIDINEAENDSVTPLFYAAFYNHFEWIPTLLEFGADPSLSNAKDANGSLNVAIDIAWNKADIMRVIELLIADSPFPKGFDLNKIDLNDCNGIETIFEERKEFHENIEANKLEAVEAYLEENNNAKYVYNANNSCALSTALNKKNFEMYAFLRSKGLAKGLDETHDYLMKTLSLRDRRKLDSEIQKYFMSANLHVLDLVSKSRLGFNNDPKNFSKIQEFFELLDEIPKVQPILKLLANHESLSIIFDFNSSSICEVDHSAHENVRGRAYNYNGRIVIGAKRRNHEAHRECSFEVLGTLAHEMTHFAMSLLYNNKCRPYRNDNGAREMEFKEVISDTKALMESLNHPVIRSVFGYAEDKIPAELIVRIPQLMALHFREPEKLDKVRGVLGKLFNFYDLYFLPEIEIELSLIEPKSKVRELNKMLGTLYSLKSFKNRCEKIRELLAETIDGSGNRFVSTTVPQFVMSSLITAFNLDVVESKNVVITTEQLMDNENQEKIRSILEMRYQPTILILDSIDVETAAVIATIVFEFAQKTRIVMISSRSHEDVQFRLPDLVNVELQWDDLSDDLKQSILQTEIIFQDTKVTLNELLHTDSKIWSRLPIDEIFGIKNLNFTRFEKFLPPAPKVFVERTFKSFSSDGSYKKTVEDIMFLLEKQKTLVLADSAGMGKTTSAVNLSKKLKKSNRLSWVIFVDLKCYTSIYLKDDEDQTASIDVAFFTDKLLSIENNFEKKLFEELYESSKIIFVVDGFDEISPSFKKYVLKFLKTIQASKNHLVATTRVHLSDELETKLGVRSITFHPFNADNQKDFLTCLWTEKQKNMGSDVKSKVKSVLNKLRLTLGQEFLENPLQLFMLAEIDEIQHASKFDERQLNYYSLYDQFVTNKIDIWNSRGPLAHDDNTNLHKSPFNILQIHQKIALQYFFGKNAIDSLLLPKIKKPLTEELISRIGIMKISTEAEFLFVHQTFAEFLVASFILLNILTKTPLSSYDALHKILLIVFTDEKYENIRKFVDGHLAIKADELEIEDLAEKFQESLKIENNRDFLSHLVEEKHLNIVTLILSELTMKKETKLQLVQHRTNNSGNALHRAIKNHKSFEVLWNCIAKFSQEAELKELLFSQGWSERNVLACAIELKAEKVLKIVLDFIKSSMNAEELERLVSHKYDIRQNSFRTVLQEAAKYFVTFPFELLWDAIERKLNVEQQKQLLRQGNFDEFFGFLYNLETNSSAMIAVLKAIKTIYNHDEVLNLLKQGDQLFDVSIFYAEEADLTVFEIFWRFVQEYFDKIEQKSLLLKRNIQNEHIFLFANDDKRTTKFLFKSAVEVLELQDFQEILFTTHEDGRLGLGTAFDTASIEIIKGVLQKLESIDRVATKKHIREYLLRIDDQGETILHRLFTFNNGQEPVDLAKFIMKHLSTAEIKALAFHKDNNGSNLFFYIADHSKIITSFMVCWAINFFSNEDWERFMSERDNESKNILHHICYKGNHEVPSLLRPKFDTCLALYDNTMPDVKPMLLAEDENGRTPLETSLHNESSTLGIFELAWRGYEQILTSEELEKVVFGKGKDFFSTHDGQSETIISCLVEAVVAKFGKEKVCSLSESAKIWILRK